MWPLLLMGCDLQKNVDIILPAYASKLAVEAYLEPGKPYRLLLTETRGYFDTLGLPLVNDASVVISHGGQDVRLEPGLYVDSVNFKAFNYTSTQRVPATYDQPFSLLVEDASGRRVTATTYLQPVVAIDTVEWYFNDDSLAYLLTRFYDQPGVANYYRFIINRHSVGRGAEVDFTIDDALLDGQRIPLGTGFNYARNDTLVVRLYQIDQAYYRFLESAADARNANGNPFAQPAPLVSGVTGGLGVFTGPSHDQRLVIVR